MRHFQALALTAAFASAAASAAMAATPPTTALTGSVTTGNLSGSGIYSCEGNGTSQANIPNTIATPSTYIRPVATGPITINLGTLVYQGFNKRTGGQVFFNRYNGTASLIFSTTTSGKLVWDFLPTGNNINEGAKTRHFSGYSQTYNPTSHVLTVNFQIDFGGCSLPVIGIFHG